jgi:hypothetical protein
VRVTKFNRIADLTADLDSCLENASVGVMRFRREFFATVGGVSLGDVSLPANVAVELRQLVALSRQLLRTVPVDSSSPSDIE